MFSVCSSVLDSQQMSDLTSSSKTVSLAATQLSAQVNSQSDPKKMGPFILTAEIIETGN